MDTDSDPPPYEGAQIPDGNHHHQRQSTANSIDLGELGSFQPSAAPPPPPPAPAPAQPSVPAQSPMAGFYTLGSDDEDIELDQSLNQNLLYGINSNTTRDLAAERNSLKEFGLKRLGPKEHFVVSLCRDVSLILILKNLWLLWTTWYRMVRNEQYERNVTAVRGTEFFLAGVWCLVSALLSYCILDGLMARWMVMYAVQAAIVRILSMSLLIVVLVELLNYMFNNADNEFCLPAWIIISCVLTLIYIIQNYVTSNLRLNKILLDSEGRASTEGAAAAAAAAAAAVTALNMTPTGSGTGLQRSASGVSLHHRIDSTTNAASAAAAAAAAAAATAGPSSVTSKNEAETPHRKVDLYNLTVFAVVPIGVASFLTMVGLVRLVVILRLEIGEQLAGQVATQVAEQLG